MDSDCQVNGRKEERSMERVEIAIIGSGPAGLTAAIYTARAKLKPVIFEGIQPGGQLMTTTLVENYPGFENGIDGPELMDNMRNQAKRFGTVFFSEIVESVNLDHRPFMVSYGENKSILADSIIIATGASAKWLDIPSEQNLRGFGVSSCATCDGFFFQNKRLAVIGGGDTAMEDSLHLTRFASKVTVIHRRNELRASKIMQERALKHPKIDWKWDSVVEEVYGSREKGVTGLKIKNVKTNAISDFDVDGLFVAIGHHPNTDFLQNQLDLDEKGFIKLPGNSVKTNIPGVFAAGDVIDPRYRQAVTAAGMGCMAALEVQQFLETNPLNE